MAELYHHGVKGMKWGVRRAQPVSGSHGRKKKNAKAEKKASIKRGEELYRRLGDPKEIRWNEDRNNRLIKKMSKKDWQDVERYKHDQNVKVYAATALTAIGGLGIAYLANR